MPRIVVHGQSMIFQSLSACPVWTMVCYIHLLKCIYLRFLYWPPSKYMLAIILLNNVFAILHFKVYHGNCVFVPNTLTCRTRSMSITFFDTHFINCIVGEFVNRTHNVWNTRSGKHPRAVQPVNRSVKKTKGSVHVSFPGLASSHSVADDDPFAPCSTDLQI